MQYFFTGLKKFLYNDSFSSFTNSKFYLPLFDSIKLPFCSQLFFQLEQARDEFILAELNYKLHSAFVNIPGKQFVGLLNGITVQPWLVPSKAAAALLLPSVHIDQLYDYGQ